MATALLRKGDVSGAASSSEIAVSMAGESGNMELIGLCEATRGNIFLVKGALADAERCFSEALVKIRAVSNVRAEGTILINLAAAKDRNGDAAAALALWKESAALLERHGDPRYSLALANLSSALWRAGDWVGSRECRSQALSLARMANDKSVEGAMLTVDGNEALFSGRVEDAIAIYQRALEIKNLLPDARARARAMCDVANALVASSRPMEALDVLKGVDSTVISGRSEEAAAALLAAARANLASGDGPGARRLLKSALDACPEGQNGGTARVLRALGACATVDGEWYVAKRYFEDSLAMFDELGDIPEKIITRHDLAKVMDKFKLQGAEQAMIEALNEATRVGVRFPPANSDWCLAQTGSP